MSLPSLKLTALLALMFSSGAIGLAVAFVFLGVAPDRFSVALIAVFVLAAAFFTWPRLVNGWIRKGLDRLPSCSRPRE